MKYVLHLLRSVCSKDCLSSLGLGWLFLLDPGAFCFQETLAISDDSKGSQLFFAAILIFLFL